MREIRFRCFDPKEKKMIYPDVLYLDNYGTVDGCKDGKDGKMYGVEDGLVVMQFVGLKDRNGKEIFEGDVVMKGDQRAEIVFEEGGFKALGLLGYWYGREGAEFSWSEVEVIGNIWESPEMVK